MKNEKHSILIVDDSMLNVMALSKILSPDYTLITGKNGHEAIALAEEKLPDIILLDVIMPGISGFDALAIMKENAAIRKIPVIFITGMDHEKDEERGFMLGAVDYITKPFRNVSVKVRVNTHLQISRQMRLNERLGMIDPLTEIPNRRGFDDRCALEWKRAVRDRQPISFLMMDVDKFKAYNDTYGHLQGDELLKSLARVLTSTIKRSSDFVARLGGEEFVALLPNTDMKGAFTLAEAIRSNVEAMRIQTIDGATETSVTLSIGLSATMPSKEGDMSLFISRADKCLYRAKEQGRNRVVACEM
ncbi:MAG: diguanylate cyclase [Clostridiales bacterium]|nr:diguanylate cyclase [Clostridiales bacterium]